MTPVGTAWICMDNCQVFELYAYWSSVPTGVVDDSEATLNPEQQTWTSTVCRHLFDLHPPHLMHVFCLILMFIM